MLNDRVKKLRTDSREARPRISMERARLVTDAYREHAGTVSPPVLRALAFRHLMRQKRVRINEGELIVGERGPAPQATPTFPELCCHTVDDLRVIRDRDRVCFDVDDEDIALQRDEMIPFWQGRSMRDRIFSEMTPEWIECYEAGIFTEFMEQRAPGHTVAGDKVYRKGMLDLKRDIGMAVEQIDPDADPGAQEKLNQLQAMQICCDAIVEYAGRHCRAALELAADEKDPGRTEELHRIAEICRKVPANAPGTFWEALQAYWFVHIGVITELNTWDSFCPGRLDQHLYPFYRREVEAGILNPERARELLQCFWIKFNNQPAPPKVGVTMEESGTYTDFANINIGGLRADGSDGVNDLSYLLLEVVDEMRLTQPSSNVQISKRSPGRFLQKAGEVIRRGFGQPSVFNADAVVVELLRQGKAIEDARRGGTSGCVETGAFGKEAYFLTGYFNLAKVLEITLHDGLDPQTGKRLGPGTGDPRCFSHFDELVGAYEAQVNHFIDVKIRGNHVIEKLYAEEMPSPFLSLVIDDCIENAADYNAGGARYNTSYIQGVGIGTTTDSMSAIRHHVFERETLTMDDLLSALRTDFCGAEKTRQLLQNRTPRYGNDDDCADELMRQIFEIFFSSVEGRPTVRGGTYRINMLPTTCHVYFGAVTGATPEGRRAHVPLSEGISPVQGADLHGPTGVIKSAAKMDHLRTGGTLLNQKLTPDILEGESGLRRLAALIRSYFLLDGHHIQFNVVSADTLRAAQDEPEKHRNLIVRVAGYSDYFNHLSAELQDEIIARTEHGRL